MDKSGRFVPASPAALAAAPIRWLDGHYLHIECHRHEPMHFRSLSIYMLPRKSRYTSLATIVKRLACTACKMPPSVVIAHEYRQRYENGTRNDLKGWHYQLMPAYKVLRAPAYDGDE